MRKKDSRNIFIPCTLQSFESFFVKSTKSQVEKGGAGVSIVLERSEINHYICKQPVYAVALNNVYGKVFAFNSLEEYANSVRPLHEHEQLPVSHYLGHEFKHSQFRLRRDWDKKCGMIC